MTKATLFDSIVSVQWLAENLSAENLILFDARQQRVNKAGEPRTQKLTKPLFLYIIIAV